jgi:hypothetical protein
MPSEAVRRASAGPVRRGPARAVRAAFLGASAVALATAAHVAGGGAVPSVGVLVLAAVPVAWCCVVLARRSRGPVVLAVALLGLQALLHELLMVAGTGCATTALAPSAAGMAGGHAHHGWLGATCATAGSAAGSAAGSTAGSVPSPWAMTAAHLLSTVATAWVLARADRTFATVVGLLGLLARRVLGRRAVGTGAWPDARLALTTPADVAPLAARVVASTPRRGPPSRPSSRPRPASPRPRFA